MAGSVHNVNDYAPPGYRLIATHYADGKCTHVFWAEGQKNVEVVVGQHEDELKVLESFKAKHSLPVAKTIPAPTPSWAKMDEADKMGVLSDGETFIDTNKPAPKPTKRKGGNGG